MYGAHTYANSRTHTYAVGDEAIEWRWTRKKAKTCFGKDIWLFVVVCRSHLLYGIDAYQFELRYLRYGRRILVVLFFFFFRFIRKSSSTGWRAFHAFALAFAMWANMYDHGRTCAKRIIIRYRKTVSHSPEFLFSFLLFPLSVRFCPCFYSLGFLALPVLVYTCINVACVCGYLAKNWNEKSACCCSLSVRFLALFRALELWLTRLYCKPHRTR